MDKVGVRLAIWLVVGLVVSIVLGQFSENGFEGPRRPLPVDPEHAWASYPPAAPPTGQVPGDPVADLTVEESHWTDDVIGTAFAVGPHLWITAGHVLEACKRSYIRVHGNWLPVNSVTFHPTADVALAQTGAADQPPIVGVTERAPVLGQDGFHYGYPQGEPGSLYSRFIGEARLRAGKPGTPIERGWLWAEQSRTFDQGSVGGISGGPQVDRTGAVQGVNILEWPRTGRLVTAPVARLRDILPKDLRPIEAGGTTIDASNYPQHGNQVRGSDAVAFVLCSLTGKTKLRAL